MTIRAREAPFQRARQAQLVAISETNAGVAKAACR
jgi:hypothetical protein